jgi:hypothetical protein
MIKMFLIIFIHNRAIIFIVFQKLETEINFIYPEQDFFTCTYVCDWDYKPIHKQGHNEELHLGRLGP